MAEVAIANETISALKEVYLLSKFIVKTAQSAKGHHEERSALVAELDYEYLYIKSFGLLFFQNEGVIVSHEGLNSDWVRKIGWILDNLRLACSDYARLAAEKDAEYKAFSPFLNAPASPGLVDFGSMTDAAGEYEDSHVTTDDDTVSTTTQISKWSIKQHVKLPDWDWRWALSEKKKLQNILNVMRMWTSKLKELVQLTVAVNPRYRTLTPQSFQELSNNNDVRVLGLQQHVRIRQINLTPATDISESADLELHDVQLEMPPQTSTLNLGQLKTMPASNGIPVLVEFKEWQALSSQQDGDRIQELARLLASSGGSDLSVLPFRGFVKQPGDSAFAFVFDFPEDCLTSPPVSLYDTITRSLTLSPGLSLSYRFQVAQSIAKSLAAFHADEWVHKSFQSRSVVFFKSPDSSIRYDTPYLVNFEYSRSSKSLTSWTYDTDEDKNLYRHPDRQLPPQKSFNRIHDLYALGVVLLEIGVWRTARAMRDHARSRLESGSLLDPDSLAQVFVETASRDLPHSMGQSYAEAVGTCLRGDFGVSLDSGDFSLVVYDLVVEKLHCKFLAQGGAYE